MGRFAPVCRAADSRLSGAGGGNLQHAHGGVSLSPHQTMATENDPAPGEREYPDWIDVIAVDQDGVVYGF